MTSLWLAISNTLLGTVCIGLTTLYILAHVMAWSPDCVDSSNAYVIYTQFRKKDAITLSVICNILITRVWVVVETEWLLELPQVRSTRRSWASLDRNNWLIGSIAAALVTDGINWLLWIGRANECESASASKRQTIANWCARENSNDLISVLAIVLSIVLTVVHLLVYISYCHEDEARQNNSSEDQNLGPPPHYFSSMKSRTVVSKSGTTEQ